jgi:Tfp pilus assembly protein PilF
VNYFYPFDSDNTRTWPVCEALLPHVIAVTDRAEELGVALKTVARLLNQAGVYLGGRAQFAEARAAFERALRIGEQVDGPVHPEVARVVNNLGSVLRAQGDLQGARAAFERALRITEQVYRPDHPEMAINVNNLGAILKDLGDLPSARAAFELALRIDRQVYGPNQPAVAIDINNLSSVLKDLGDLQGARAAFKRALRIYQLCDDRSGEAATFRKLGTLAAETGRLGRGLGLLALVYQIDRNINHPDAEGDYERMVNLAVSVPLPAHELDNFIARTWQAYQVDKGWSLVSAAFDSEAETP